MGPSPDPSATPGGTDPSFPSDGAVDPGDTDGPGLAPTATDSTGAPIGDPTAPTTGAPTPNPTVGAGGNGSMDPPPEGPTIDEATPKTQLRLLTRVEYRNSVAFLLNAEAEAMALDLPDDLSVAGFSTVGAAEANVSEVFAEAYEKASQDLARAVFSDDARWQQLVGCAPQVDLTDACVDTYVRSFGRGAFRRALTEEEVAQWLDVARTSAGTASSAAMGLAAVTAGILQSPNFLYRVEHAEPDVALGRLRFDGESMATRLAFLLTGTTPDGALLDAAGAGQLSTTDGIRTAVEQLFARPGSTEFMSEFFAELIALQLVAEAEKDSTQFPNLDDELRASMIEEARLFLRQVVLAPDADVRSMFNSPTTFVDAKLAEFYGVPAPAAGGFQELQLGAETGRSGILSRAGFLVAHSSPDSSNPTRRGNFILKHFNCTEVPLPEFAVTLPETEPGEGPMTTRQLFEQHRIDATCVACHSVMDPFGFALEHFDAIGQYRETENGLPIDATGEYQGATFDGAIDLGNTIFESAKTPACLVKNFYRYANGTDDAKTDALLIEQLTATLGDRGYVWRDLLVDFATSDAFTSLALAAEE